MTGRRLAAGAMVVSAWLVACTTEVEPATSATPDDTTISEPTVSPSTTAPASTINLCGRGTVWESGVTYVAPCFIVPIGFTPHTDGWTASGAQLEWWAGFWTQPDTPSPAIRFHAIAYESDSDPERNLDSILAIEGVNATSAIRQSTISGIRLWSVDVATEPAVGSLELTGNDCIASPHSAIDLLFGGAPGYPLVDFMSITGGGGLFGLGACWQFRIWVLGYEGASATIIATVADLGRFDELMPRMEELVQSIAAADR